MALGLHLYGLRSARPFAILMRFPPVFRWLLLVLVAALMLPVLAVVSSWGGLLAADGVSLGLLQEMSRTVLPDYLLTTLILCVLVTGGVVVGQIGRAHV